MVKILQFGEGNFLRTFVEHYFDTLNEEGADYRVSIVKPIPFGSLDSFHLQNNRYHIVLRGMEGGQPVERVRQIRVVDQAVSPFEERQTYEKLILDPEIRIIVSNTTEAGICFSQKDSFDGFEDITYPAKLTKLLYSRYRAGVGGVYVLPVELIDNNADVLADCVEKYIDLWNLPEDFRLFNKKENIYCNTLVDRIVSGHPKTDAEREHLYALIGQEDRLVSVGEPFGLWAVEDKAHVSDWIQSGHHGIDVVLTKDIKHYKKQKVRVLNGSHTNLVAAGLCEGATTVYDCMQDKKLCAFVCDTLDTEIIPYVSEDRRAVRAFADSVLSRFENPYLNHLLTSISLNSISKWVARVLPSFEDHVRSTATLPDHLVRGFSYLMYIYSHIRRTENGYVALVRGRELPWKDEASYLAYFADGGNVSGFMRKADVFGQDLCAIAGFESAVSKNLETLEAGRSLL